MNIKREWERERERKRVRERDWERERERTAKLQDVIKERVKIKTGKETRKTKGIEEYDIGEV